jgi:diguanylate cyclase (GGDEF)-like protein
MGGDEFLLLLPEMAKVEYAGKAAERVLEVIREPFSLADHKLRVTTSLGIAIYPDDGEDGDTLVKNADVAMYSAKEAGRNNYQRYIDSEEGKSTPSSGGRRDDGRA